MSEETPQPITPVEPGTQPVAAENGQDSAAQVDQLRAKNAQLIGERRKDQERLRELQSQVESIAKENNQREQNKLAEAGEFKTLWEEANRTAAERENRVRELESQLENQAQEAQQQQVRAQALNAMGQQGVHAPDQLYTLMQGNLRARDGQVMAIHGGVETPLDQHLQNLRNPNSGFEHFFRASGTGGIGSSAAAPTATSGMSNPYSTGNLSKVIALELENPELARQLKREASAG